MPAERPAEVRLVGRPTKAYSPISATGFLWVIGLLAAASLAGVYFYVEGFRTPRQSATSDASRGEPSPSSLPTPKAPSDTAASSVPKPQSEPADPTPLVRPSAQPLVTATGPTVLTAEQEREKAANPGSEFKECVSCPVMVVVPAGKFTMGSPKNEPGRDNDEGPQHAVTISKPFAVSKYEVTFDEWDTCVAAVQCPKASDRWGRGRMPVVNVSWDDAQRYVKWLTSKTGKTYRLLSEAEWEYAARAGTRTAYSWGETIGKGKANCDGCGSQWDGKQTAPVGSFTSNAFGLYDMHGNVWEWVEDCYRNTYDKGPLDGSAWTTGDCSSRVVRGGSWNDSPRVLRAANRVWFTSDYRDFSLGFRVARTLTP